MEFLIELDGIAVVVAVVLVCISFEHANRQRPIVKNAQYSICHTVASIKS